MAITVTTSWDDGHTLDLRVAEILNRYQLKGTFYVARHFLDGRMSESDIRELAETHEIGAHTINHPVLTDIPSEQAQREIVESKKWLEDVIGKPVTSFCYPRGIYNAQHVEFVGQAGYTMARTVQGYQINRGDNPFTVPTTLQLYPFPLRPLPGVSLLRGWSKRVKPLRDAIRNHRQPGLAQFLSWEQYALSWANYANQHDGIWHLWGHSWEIERYGQWQHLDNTLRKLTGRYTIIPMTNTELVTHD